MKPYNVDGTHYAVGFVVLAVGHIHVVGAAAFRAAPGSSCVHAQQTIPADTVAAFLVYQGVDSTP